ncbi:MAG: hypothetical protein JWM57_1284 [Phycisphaerales bacterium]|nr:hypothetical protein [Phycisphaerales bacterium]
MGDVTIQLDEATALVLFDCLGRWDYDEQPLELRDDAEFYAMLKVMAGLESSLTAIVRPDYLELVQKARAELLARQGTV